jgi:hypothetical protein
MWNQKSVSIQKNIFDIFKSAHQNVELNQFQIKKELKKVALSLKARITMNDILYQHFFTQFS